MTPLHLACAHDSAEVAKILLRSGEKEKEREGEREREREREREIVQCP